MVHPAAMIVYVPLPIGLRLRHSGRGEERKGGSLGLTGSGHVNGVTICAYITRGLENMTEALYLSRDFALKVQILDIDVNLCFHLRPQLQK